MFRINKLSPDPLRVRMTSGCQRTDQLIDLLFVAEKGDVFLVADDRFTADGRIHRELGLDDGRAGNPSGTGWEWETDSGFDPSPVGFDGFEFA